MYEDKLKKELFEKIHKYHEINKEISGRVCESDLTPELFESIEEYADALNETDDEYADLSYQIMHLQEEIDELMVDTKYAPLVGLTESQIKDLDFFMKSSDSSFELNIEKHLDTRLLILKEEMKKRLKEIETLRMSTYLDPRTYHIYNEVIRCYINGAFEASCVLCRAIAEVIAKRFIEYKGYGDLLIGKEKQFKKLTIPGILSEKLSIQKEVITIYSKIARKADKILHEKNKKAEEKDALEAIRLLQSFIKKFPKTL